MKRAKKSAKSSKFFMGVFILLLLALAGYAAIILMPVGDDFAKIDSVRVEGDSLILTNNCTALIASTSQERLESIALGLQNKVDVRPTTHENFVSVMNAFNITLERVVIHRFEDDIFYSDSYFVQGDKILQLDMRPSDAIALAVRTKSPIYINKTILAEKGTKIC
ncbi:MAG: bifunctional nuclease family protein [Candidatus Aenigmarchaeota archaeon]|nr:bifunctional nuclease family protein [Candidatus Aenigmarchaeota archaeon]